MPPRILLAGGGTGGHVYPAVAIADAIRAIEPEAAIAFAGTRDRMEWEAVPKAGYAIHPIEVVGLQRSLTPRNLAFPLKLGRGLWQSRELVRSFDPDVAVGTGGYVSGPVLLMASLAGRPIVLQEQNAYAGMTNTLLARRAARVHVAFPEAKEAFPVQAVLSGNPVRPEIAQADRAQARAHFELPDDALFLCIFGGSLGSGTINDAMEQHVAALLEDERLHILWQSGKRYYPALSERVPAHPRLRLQQYVDRMDLAYAAADLALCRAGALTCSELMVTGTPAILVPSPNVTADHQTLNARSMSRVDAAILLPEPQLHSGLLEAVRGLAADPERREAMREAALRMARPAAAEHIARDVLSIAGWEGA